jgi:hypothetical protein
VVTKVSTNNGSIVDKVKESVEIPVQSNSASFTVNDPHHGTLTISYEFVTPEIAKRWLDDYNKKNRRQNRRHVDMIVRQISGGYWMLTTDALAFDWDGALLNGQHRLKGLVETGSTEPFVVIRGMDPESFNIIDGGRKREASDLLDRLGSYVNTTALGSALRAIMFYRERGHFGNPGISYSNAEVVRHLEDEVGIEYAVQRSKSLRQHGLKSTPPAVVAALYHIFSECSPDDVDPFMEKWATGLGITRENDPVYALRRRLDDPAIKSKNVKAALAIKAWNYYREGKSVTKMQIPEEFPKPL